MTQRKPPNVSFPDWVEQQIRTAEAQGAFANLSGAGRPIPDLGRIQPEDAWLVNYLRRENADIAAVLPPALALAKEAEDLPERLLTIRSEAAARAVVDDLNTRISTAHQRPQVGPPMRVRPVNVDRTIHEWRAAQERATRPAAVAEAAVAVPTATETTRPRRWRPISWGRRS